MVLSCWKTVWQFFKRLNIELPYHPAIPLPGIYIPKRNENTCPHKNLYKMIILALFITAKK